MNKIIIINGSSNTGKDTFFGIFDKFTEVEVLNYSTINDIRRMFEDFGYEEDRMESEYRKLMSNIKSFLIKYNDIPFTKTIEQYDIYDMFLEDFVMFVHCREPSEIKKLVEYFGDRCITLLLKRSGIEIPDNFSDMNVNNYDYDYTIFNVFDLKNLEKEVKIIIGILGVK